MYEDIVCISGFLQLMKASPDLSASGRFYTLREDYLELPVARAIKR